LAARLAVDAPSVPVVLLGERGEERRLVEAFRAGAAGVFTKACIGEDFLRGVTAVLGGQRAMGVELLPFVLGDGLPDPRPGLDPMYALSPAELRIFEMLGQARTVAEISAACGLSEKRVRNQLAGIYRKTGLKNRTQVVIRAAQIGHESGRALTEG
jgi:DNA-binding NarL/FixJ family response regulator